jgi:hypothetical protein
VVVRNGASLATLAQASATENKILTNMTDKTQQDSRTMRIATIVAMIYLPANLVIVRITLGTPFTFLVPSISPLDFVPQIKIQTALLI